MGPQASDERQIRELGRLRWRCRRGMRELDILLARYLEERFRTAPAPEQAAFLRLLDAADTDIHAYCLGFRQAPADLADVIPRLAAPNAAGQADGETWT